jgi:hypothetical protein
MNDEQLDDALQGLRAELNVEPSPEFAAKVRQQVEQMPARSFWSVWAWTSVAATCGIAVIAGALWFSADRNSVTTTIATATPNVAPTISPAPSPNIVQTTTPAPVPSVQMTANATRTTRVTHVAAPKEKELEVLISPDELLIVRQLMSEARNNMRREGPPSRMLIDPATGELIPAKPIEIPLITVELLPATTENRSGGRQ